MSDFPTTESDADAPRAAASPSPPTPEPAAAPRRRAGAIGLALLVMLVVVAALGWRHWRTLQEGERRAETLQQAESALQRRVAELEAALDSARRGLRALETRAGDNAATNKVLREELLGMGERATLLEDAVGRLADNRLRGEVVLRLNEAEFLLLLGEERLRLFGDVPATIQAYNLTEAALAGIDDAQLATLRQTLAQELLALREVPADPRAAIRAELAQLGDTVVALPASRSGEIAATDGNDSRLVRLLAQLVTVRRIDARDTVLGPAQREATLAALRLQLQLAQAALARPDPAAYAHALDQASALAARLFDAQAPGVVALQATLQRLRGETLVPELPVLGATLRELRGLRAMRSVATLAPEVSSDAAIVPDAVPPAVIPDAQDGDGQ